MSAFKSECCCSITRHCRRFFNRAWTETCKDTPLMSPVRSPGMGNKVINGDVHRFPLLDVPQSCDYEVVVKCICAERKEHRSVQISSGKPHTKILTQQVLRPADFTYPGGQSWTGPWAPWPSAPAWGPCRSSPGWGWPPAAGGGRSRSGPAAPWSCCTLTTSDAQEETEEDENNKRCDKILCSSLFKTNGIEKVSIQSCELGFVTEPSRKRRSRTVTCMFTPCSDKVWENRWCCEQLLLWEQSE